MSDTGLDMVLRTLLIAGLLLLPASPLFAVGSGFEDGRYSADETIDPPPPAELADREEDARIDPDKPPEPVARGSRVTMDGDFARALPPPGIFAGRGGVIIVVCTVAGLFLTGYFIFSWRRGRKEQVVEDSEFSEEINRQETAEIKYRRPGEP